MADKYVMQPGSSQSPQGYYPLQPQPVMPYPTTSTSQSPPPPPPPPPTVMMPSPGQQMLSMSGYGGGMPQGMMGSFPALKPVVWMQKPVSAVPGCPPGLEYLTQIDQLLVHQQVELMEVFTNWETSNRYQVKNSLGQQIYFAAEESDSCMRQCCGPQRNFVMHVSDNAGQEVIRVVRDFKCCGGCCQCLAGISSCADEVVVEAPPGITAGCVVQSPSCCQPSYEIRDAADQPVLHISGPMCVCEGPFCIGEQEFRVLSADKSREVGKICKQWSGFLREYFTDADNFGVNFPIDLDVRMKATMIGAVFLIDFAFFEDNQQNTNRS